MATKTYINFVLDRSGSMAQIQEATITGFNNYLKAQRAEPGKTRWTLTLFDSVDEQEVVFENYKGRDVPKLTTETYVPRAATPLLDAVGEALTRALAYTKALSIRNEGYDRHILVVMTDGYENASKEFSSSDVKKLIKKAEKRNWQVIFLGANQDAWNTGSAMFGMVTGTTIMYAADAKSVAATMDSVSETSSAYRNTNQVVTSHLDTKDGTEKEQKTKTGGVHKS